jgi:hypothetical protein
MSAWTKQAVPLVFLEIGTAAVLKTNGHHAAIRRIQARIDRWLHECWQPLRDKGRIDDDQAQRITTKAAASIQDNLSKVWRDGGMKTPSELPSAMLALAEDVRQQLPRNDKKRLRAWGYLVTALYDLCLVADPELTDNLGQERGLQIAAVVLREAA